MLYPDKHRGYVALDESQTGKFPHHLQALKKDIDIKNREKSAVPENLKAIPNVVVDLQSPRQEQLHW